MVKQCEEKSRRFNCTVNVVILDDELAFAEMLDKQIEIHCIKTVSYTHLTLPTIA